MKKSRTILIMILIIISTGTAFASLSSYHPESDVKVKDLWNAEYSRADGKKDIVLDNVIRPYYERYRHGIQRYKKGGGYSKVTGGKALSKKSLKLMVSDAAVKFPNSKTSFSDSNYYNNYYWFDLTSTSPQVTYTGYRIWSDDEQGYVKLYMTATLKNWSKANAEKLSVRGKSHPRLLGIRNANEVDYDGLPSIVIWGIDSAELEFKYYRAVDTEKPSSSWRAGNQYKIRTNVTYKDIDEHQAISVRSNSSGGFTGWSGKTPGLKFGQSSQNKNYYAISSKADKDKHDTDKEYWMSFDLDGSSVGMIYTSNQTNNKKPSGAWSFFKTETYNAPVNVTLNAPAKNVYSQDSDEYISYGTHNKLSTQKEPFYYIIKQPIKSDMQSGNAYSLTSLTFRDTIDDCLAVSGDIRFYMDSVGGMDITNCFEGSVNGKKIVYSARKTAAAWNKIYNNGNGGTVLMKIPVKAIKSGDDIENHRAVSLRSNNNEYNKSHKQGSNIYLDIPNEACVSYTPKGGSTVSNWTDTVKTRMNAIPKHDIILKKEVSGEVPDRTKQFTFNVYINNGAVYTCTITRANNKTERLDIKRKAVVKLAAGDYLTIPKVPQGVTYRFLEKGHDQYEPYFAVSNPGNCLDGTETSGHAEEGENLDTAGTLSSALNYSPVTYTFTNKRNVKHHDLKITKQESNADVSKSFDFRLELKKLNPDAQYQTSIGQINTDSRGECIYTFSLRHDQTMIIRNLPDDCKYRIIEEGSSGYVSSFNVTEGTDLVKGSTGNGKRGQGLKTPEENFSSTGDDYDINYEIFNDSGVLSDITVRKKTAGGAAKTTDEFSFEMQFTGIPKKYSGDHRSIGVEIYKDNNEKEVLRCKPSKVMSTDHYTESFTLRSDECAHFINVPGKVTYTLTEKGNDYTASCSGELTEDKTGRVLKTYSNANSKAYKDLSVNDTLASDTSAAADIVFTNHRDPEPVYNTLKIEKLVTNATNDQFDFVTSFSGLTKNHEYAMVSEKGDDEYELIRDAGALRIRSGKGTIGDPFKYTGGIPLEITRADGEKKMIFSSPNITDNNLLPIQEWIDYKGGTFFVSWAGGNWTEELMDRFDEPYIGSISGKAYKNCNVKCYKIASLADKQYVEEQSFYPLRDDISEKLRSKNYTELTNELCTYIAQHGISASSDTDADNRSSYKFENLEFGLYLVTYSGTDEHEGNSILVSVPGTVKDVDADDTNVLETDNRSVFKGTIETFTSDTDGRADVDHAVSDGEIKETGGLPENSAYKTLEKGSEYLPSYIVTRNSLKTDFKSGKKETDLATRLHEFNQDAVSIDHVLFTNDKKTYMLKTNKHTNDESLEQFDFNEVIKGLKKESYMTMIPGEGDFTITMDEQGNIKLETQHYTKSIKDIPVKLIRPCDKAERICLTNSQGIISSDEFITWLSKNQDGDYGFEIVWNGGRITGRFSA